jgi:hypothetical protein
MMLSAGLALVSNPASATPASGAALGETGQATSSLLLVRDNCGRGRHFSRYRGICVWDRAPYRAYGYPEPGYGYYGPPVYGPPVYGPPMYGPGFYGPGYGYGYYRRW